LAEGPLLYADAIRFAIGLAESLREIHRQGRVYGLLQPSGIAVIEGEVCLMSAVGARLTPYLSPEQVAGDDLDWRSDIFSLGCIMYEMFSGRRAFRATAKAALHMEILNRDSALLDDIPPALARLIQRCLEKKPERRIQRMEILLAELKLRYALAGGEANGSHLAPEPPPAREITRELVLAPRPESVAAPETPPEREKLKLACPVCGARDIHTSRPRGPLEAVLGTAGVPVGRCYRCYHRFMRVAGFNFSRGS
jgi:hypothetical protein